MQLRKVLSLLHFDRFSVEVCELPACQDDNLISVLMGIFGHGVVEETEFIEGLQCHKHWRDLFLEISDSVLGEIENIESL